MKIRPSSKSIFWGLLLFVLLPGTSVWSQQGPVKAVKPLATETLLVLNRKPQAVIIAPADAEGVAAARELQRQLREKTGCLLPLASDQDAWPTYWGKTNLIVVGNLMNNRVFANLYCLHYACSDGSWPGDGGYEVRTICDPRGTKRNVIAIGGSDSRGIKRAVDAFLRHVPEGRTLKLGFFIDTLVDGKPFTPLTSEEMDKSSDTFVDQVVNYYRTGNPQYAEMAKKGYLKLVDEMTSIGTIGFTSGRDWYGICWDLIEEAPVFRDDERLRITNALVQMMEKSVNTYAPIQDQPRPFHGVDMQTVHIYDTARYFEDCYPDCSVARKIMDRERTYWAVQQRYWTQDCQSSWYQGSDGAYIIQYALQALDFDWFESGRFKKWLEWYWASCDNMGFMSGYGDCGWGSVHPYALWALQVGAWYYRDGWMQWTADRNHLPRRGGFNLGHAFYTGEVKPAPPLHLGGLYRIGVDDWMVEYRRPGFANDRAFNKVSFQDGYTPGTPYMLLDGTGNFPHGHPSTNQIVGFTQNGYYWLYGGGYMVFQTTEHNVMGVFHDGKGETPPPLAELRHHAAVPGLLFSQSLLHEYNGVDWVRSVLWRQGGTVLVIDRAQARRNGQFGLQVVWRCAPREIDAANRSVHVLPNRAQLEFMRNSHGLPLTTEEMNRPRGTFHLYNADTSTLGIKETAHDGLNALFESAALSLKEGEGYTFRNLFFVTEPGKERPCRLEPVGEGAVFIRETEGVSLAGTAPMPLLTGIDTDAAMFWISPQRIGLAGVSRLSAFGLRFDATIPVSLSLDCRTGMVTINPPTQGNSDFTVEQNGVKRTGTVSGSGASWTEAIAPAAFPEEIEKSLGDAWDSIRKKNIPSAATKSKSFKPENSGIRWRVSNDQFVRAAGQTEVPSPPGTSKVRIADLEGDRKPEMLVARSDGRLFCLESGGRPQWRFDAPAPVWDVCAGDVDRDGKMEVALVCAASASSGENSFLILLDSGGHERWRVPCPQGLWTWKMQGLPSPRGEASGPRRGNQGPLLLCWIADLNGDGEMEIGAASRNFFVYNFDPAGRERWEVMCPYHRPLAWRIQDLNKDRIPELIVANDFYTLVYRGDGSHIPDAFLPPASKVVTSGNGVFKIEQPGPAIEVADLYGDGRFWMVNGTRTGAITVTPYDPVSDSAKSVWSFNTGATVDAVAILETDGQKRIIAGSRNMFIYCLDREGHLIWTRCLGEMVRTLVTTDLDADGQAEILAGCDDGTLYRLNGKGEITGRRALGSPVRHLLILPSRYKLDWNLLVGTWNGDLQALLWKGNRRSK